MIPRVTSELGTVSTLDDRPNDTGGLTAAELKAKFDADAGTLKDYVNDVLIPFLEGTSAAASLGITTISGFSADNIQTALEEIIGAMQGITQGSVADGSITLAKLAAEVTAIALGGAAASHTHGAGDIASGTLDASRIPVLDASKLGAGSVGSSQLASSAVTTQKIKDGAVTADKLAALAVFAQHIANGAITAPKLAAGAVGTSNLGDGVVTRAKLAQDAIGKKVDWSSNSSPITAQYNNYFIYMRNTIAKSFTITAEDFAALPDGYTLTILALASSPVTISWASGIPVMDAVQRTNASSGGSITLDGNGDMVTIFKRPADGSSIAAGLILTGQLNPRTIWVGTAAPSGGADGDVYIRYS